MGDVRRVPVRRFWMRAGLSLLGLALTGCGVLGAGQAPTVTPFPFVTASPRPAATHPPVTASVPPLPTPSVAPPSPTLRGSPVVPTIGPEDTATAPPSPTIPGVESDCLTPPQGGFRDIYESDPGLPSAIGCPASPNLEDPAQAWTVDTHWQLFERGAMLWSSAVGWDLNAPVVYVLYDDGTYERFEDAYVEGRDPPVGDLPPPAGLFEPVDNLGKIWREGPGVSARLGWATVAETRDFTHMQVFTNGEMIFVVAMGRTYVFKHGSPNTWLTYDVRF